MKGVLKMYVLASGPHTQLHTAGPRRTRLGRLVPGSYGAAVSAGPLTPLQGVCGDANWL